MIEINFFTIPQKGLFDYTVFNVWVVCPLVCTARKWMFIFKVSFYANYCWVLNTPVVQGDSPKPLGLLNLTQALFESQLELCWPCLAALGKLAIFHRKLKQESTQVIFTQFKSHLALLQLYSWKLENVKKLEHALWYLQFYVP